MDSKVEQLHSRADSLIAKFEQGDGSSNIDEAIVLDREALELCPPGHHKRSVSLTRLAIHLNDRFNHLGVMMDVEEAIVLDREALELRPPGHPDRLVSLNSLADCLSTLYMQVSAMEDLDEAIVLARDALALCPLGHPGRSMSFNNLAIYLSTRYKQLGTMEDLSEAIVLVRQALDLCPPEHPDRSTSLNNLANFLSIQYEQLGEMTVLEEAILLARDALALCPLGHPDRSVSFNNLAIYLSTRYKQLGTTEDLGEAIFLIRQALDLCPPGHPDRSTYLNTLATFLSIRYEQLGEMTDLEEAIALHREALSFRPHGHPDRSTSLNDLATDLSTWYDRVGDMTALDEAIVLVRQALDLRPSGHPLRSTSLNNFANCLFTRYKPLGEMANLEQAISLHQEALHLRPPGHPLRSTSLNNLANCLSTRYKQLGEMRDLEQTVALHREALLLRPPGHPDRSTSLNDLANDLSTWYDRVGDMTALDEAIVLVQQALDLRPSGHPLRPTPLNNLADCLFTRYKQLGEMTDLEQAIFLRREALHLCPPGHPLRSSSLNNLADHLSLRYNQLAVMRDLDELITLHREALGLFPPGHPRRSHTLQCLAHRLHTRFTQLRKLEDQEELFSLYAQLEHVPQTVSSDDLYAAKAWIEAAEDFQHPTTLLAYETSLRLLIQHLASLPLLPQDLVALKKLTSSLAVDAFSACLRKHAPTNALELLELGRGVFWGQLTQLRSPFDDVVVFCLAGKTLADEFTRLTSLIQNAFSSPDPLQHDQARYLNIRLRQVVSNIRHLPGLSRFLLPPLFVDLQLAASRGPVIVVNASEYSCDALVVLLDQNPVHIPLQITKARVRELSLKLRTSILHAKRVNVTRDLGVILRELWDQVVSPIVDFLRTIYPSQSRIWWCPTAEFSHLPLHAAGPYRKGQQNLDDLYIPSYTTTLTALTRARRPYALSSATERKRIVAIGQAHVGGESKPISVRTEMASVARRFEDITIFTRLEGPECCISRVTEELSKNHWVHIACHGLPNSKQPFESAFALRDGHLTIQRIVQCNLENPQFAYLSACHTAVGDEESSDEVIHLASAMQFAGFRSVIGTMGAVDDAQTKRITSMFYDNIMDESGRLDPTRAAFALHKTMKNLADIPFDQRILYIHLGI